MKAPSNLIIMGPKNSEELILFYNGIRRYWIPAQTIKNACSFVLFFLDACDEALGTSKYLVPTCPMSARACVVAWNDRYLCRGCHAKENWARSLCKRTFCKEIEPRSRAWGWRALHRYLFWLREGQTRRSQLLTVVWALNLSVNSQNYCFLLK